MEKQLLSFTHTYMFSSQPRMCREWFATVLITIVDKSSLDLNTWNFCKDSCSSEQNYDLKALRQCHSERSHHADAAARHRMWRTITSLHSHLNADGTLNIRNALDRRAYSPEKMSLGCCEPSANLGINPPLIVLHSSCNNTINSGERYLHGCKSLPSTALISAQRIQFPYNDADCHLRAEVKQSEKHQCSTLSLQRLLNV